MTGNLAAALADWSKALGPLHVTADPVRLAKVNRATLAHAARNTAVIAPADEDEVAECLRIGARHGVRVHVASRGRNWGYGSRLPREDSVLLLLSRLDRVELHGPVAVVEPGVSFAGLAAALQGTPYLPPQIGAGGSTSVLGNLLQRGLAKPPYADMASHLAWAEIRSSGGTSARIARIDDLPEGAAVVRAGIRLLRATALRQFAWARLPDEAALGALVNAAAPLLDHRDDRLQMEAVNAAKCRLQAPPGTIWPVGPGEWIVGFTLWGEDRDEIDARREAVPCALTAEPPESPSTPLFGNEGLRSAYRVKGSMPPDPDPDRDQCGVAWFVPVLPLDGAEIASSLVVAQSLLKDHGFPPAISMRSGHDGRVKIVIGIFFDRARRGWDERARACHDALLAEFGARGHASYRRSVWTG